MLRYLFRLPIGWMLIVSLFVYLPKFETLRDSRFYLICCVALRFAVTAAYVYVFLIPETLRALHLRQT